MSLEGNRCANCGARMRLVNVTKINTFRTPEASQYDVSVSRRNGGNFVQSSSRELLCTCCGYRIPAGKAKAVKPKKEKKVKETVREKETTQKDTSRKAIEKRNDRIIFWIKLLMFLAVVAVTAYFVYQYRDVIMGYYNQIMDIVNKVTSFVDRFKK